MNKHSNRYSKELRSPSTVVLLVTLLSLGLWLAFPIYAALDDKTFKGDQDIRVLRLGVPYYDDYGKTFAHYQQMFSKPIEIGINKFSVQIVVGTYDEVLSWYHNDQVDLVVLPPGAVADHLTVPGEPLSKERVKELESLYIGSIALTSMKGTNYPLLKYGVGQKRFKYRAYCVTRNVKDAFGKQLIGNYDELLKKARNHELTFLFVHPLSVSGRILPEFKLRQDGVALKPNEVEWTYNHDYSLTKLLSGNNKVAFVWDALESKQLNDKEFYWFPFPDESVQIPQEILVSTRRFLDQYQLTIEQLQSAVRNFDQEANIQQVVNFSSDYTQLLEWVSKLKSELLPQKPVDSLASSNMNIDQITARLRNYAFYHKKPNEKLKLALVLSGGGAKCAYQFGVIQALEEKLSAIRREEPDVDIHLVVGTSGGSINALATSLGITSDEGKRKDLAETWLSFRHTDFLDLRTAPHVTLGIFLGVVETLAVILFVQIFGNWRSNWWSIITTIIIALIILQTIVYFFDWSPSSTVGSAGKVYYLNYFWLLFTLSLGWTTLLLSIFVVLIFASNKLLGRRKLSLLDHNRRVVIALCLVVVIVQLGLLYFIYEQPSLSDSQKFEYALSQKLYGILKKEPSVGEIEKFELLSNEERLQTFSQKIINSDLLKNTKRSMIITGSVISSSEELRKKKKTEISSDLYFYLGNEDQNKFWLPPDDAQKRFISLKENPSALLDVVVGSSTIFPVFPPKRINCLNYNRTNKCIPVELIDGGFIHNSPLEAAVIMGATHVIVVEASPLSVPTTDNDLLTNALVSFNYLFTQAQSLDARVRGRREVFVIRPDKTNGIGDPNLSTFDFSGTLIKASIDKGLNDALNITEPKFEMLQGRPF
jgi:predicted acylesterase/phospholipase RssA